GVGGDPATTLSHSVNSARYDFCRGSAGPILWTVWNPCTRLANPSSTTSTTAIANCALRYALSVFLHSPWSHASASSTDPSSSCDRTGGSSSNREPTLRCTASSYTPTTRRCSANANLRLCWRSRSPLGAAPAS